MSEDERNELKIVWPPPREDPDEEPAEPWARLSDRLESERPDAARDH